MTTEIMRWALVALAAVALSATPAFAGSHEDAVEMETPKEGSGGRTSAPAADEAAGDETAAPAPDGDAGKAEAPAPAPREGS